MKRVEDREVLLSVATPAVLALDRRLEQVRERSLAPEAQPPASFSRLLHGLKIRGDRLQIQRERLGPGEFNSATQSGSSPGHSDSSSSYQASVARAIVSMRSAP